MAESRDLLFPTLARSERNRGLKKGGRHFTYYSLNGLSKRILPWLLINVMFEANKQLLICNVANASSVVKLKLDMIDDGLILQEVIRWFVQPTTPSFTIGFGLDEGPWQRSPVYAQSPYMIVTNRTPCKR